MWQGEDLTIKGCRDSFKKFGRGGVITTEINGTYKISKSDTTTTGCHWIPKTQVCKWTHSEADGNLTGNGALAARPDEYLFMHDVSGQVVYVEEVMEPDDDGF